MPTDSRVDHVTVLAALRWCVRTRADQTAFVVLDQDGTPKESVTYLELDLRARATAARLQRRAELGDRVLLLYPTGIEFIVAFLGCLYAGLIAVPAPHPGGALAARRKLSRLRAISADAGTALVLAPGNVAVPEAEEHTGSTPWLSLDELDLAPAGELRVCPAAPDTLALLQYTSGSTSAPKGVMISHGNIVSNMATGSRALPADEASATIVSWLPLFHDMGLGQVLLSIHTGIRCVLIPPTAFVMRPVLWLEAISRYRAYYSPSPNFGYDLCTTRVSAEQRAALDLSCWRFALNGSEPLRPRTIDAFADTFADAKFRRSAFMPAYGLAEATVLVSGVTDGRDPVVHRLDRSALVTTGRIRVAGEQTPENAKQVVACGRVADNLDVRIVDPDRLVECAADQIGEIWVAGPSVGLGYWGREADTRAKFGARLAGGEGPFLRTGDLGFLSDGRLSVIGRIDDMVVIDGRNHFPQDIELTVEQSHELVAPNGCAAFGYDTEDGIKLGVVAELRRGTVFAEPDDQGSGVDRRTVLTAIRREVAAEHDIGVSALVLLKPGGLPRTTSGKTQRRKSRELYLAGALKAL